MADSDVSIVAEAELHQRLVAAHQRTNEMVHEAEHWKGKAEAYKEEMWLGPRCAVCDPDMAEGEAGAMAWGGKSYVCWGCYVGTAVAQ